MEDNSPEQEEKKNIHIDSIWEEMKKTEEQPPKATTPSPTVSQPNQIKVIQTYDFAGEQIKYLSYSKLTLQNDQNNYRRPNQKVQHYAHSFPRKGNLDAILGGLKKKKMSTLEKSKLDWGSFKDKEGLQDELNQHLKSKNR